MNIINDIPLWGCKKYQLGLQEECTPIAAGIYDLHEKLLFFLIFIFFVIFYALYMLIYLNSPKWNRSLTHNVTLEIIWTIIPSIILIIIAIPSFKLLYAQDEVLQPLLTIKAIGQQWFWSYEFSDIEGLSHSFDSYTLNDESLNIGQYRLLDVDTPLYMPILTPIRLLTTSLDVIHSFAIPSFGIKIDAIPGRINHSNIYILREGSFFGQCSELCGQSHYNMSIHVIALHPSQFLQSFASSL